MNKLEKLGYEAHDTGSKNLIRKSYRRRLENGDDFVTFLKNGDVMFTCQEREEVTPFIATKEELDAVLAIMRRNVT